jgi:O-antigen/teichoic acid export membrane protein
VKRLFNNTLITFVDYGVLIGLNLAATPLLIANFGIDGYGAFVFLTIFSIYGALAVFDLGMEGALMNYIARFQASGDRRRMHDALTVSLVYYSGIGLVLGVGIYFGGGLLASRLLGDGAAIEPETVYNAIALVAVNIVFQFVNMPLTATLQGMRRYVATKTVNSVMNIIRYVLVVAVAVMYHRIDAGFAVVLALTIVRQVALAYLLLFRVPDFAGWRPHLDLSLFRRLFNYSSILFVTRIIGLVHNQMPKVLIWYYLPVASMTVFDVVARPAMLVRVIMGTVVSAIIPEAAQLHQRGEKAKIRWLYLSLIRYTYLIILPILAVLFVYIHDFMRLWVGAELAEHAYLSLILLAGYLILPAPTVANTMVVGLEKVRQTIWIPIVGTTLNLVVSVVLLQVVGLAGLLLGTLVSQLFTLIPYVRFMKRFTEFSYSDLVLPLAPALLVALGSSVLNLGVRTIFGNDIWILAAGVFVTLGTNYFINVRFLLKSDERAFLADRLARLRGAILPNGRDNQAV